MVLRMTQIQSDGTTIEGDGSHRGAGPVCLRWLAVMGRELSELCLHYAVLFLVRSMK